MTDRSNSPVLTNYFLEPGYIFLAINPTSISAVAGSSVSVSIYDRNRKVGGMNLFRFPYVREKDRATAEYGNVATITLIRMMLHDGSRIKDLEAQILGGAHNNKISPKNIGRDNIMAARKILAKERISVASEDVGGDKGRKVVFNTSAGEVAVIKVDKLRAADWYPYTQNR